MDGKIVIILLTTLMPAFVVGYLLRSGGKNINFAAVGGTVVYVVSVLIILFSIFVAEKMNMRADDLVLILPLVVAALFYLLLRGMKTGDE